MNEHEPLKTEHKTAGLLGIASSQLSSVDACPTDKQMAVFLENKLQGHLRETLLMHLNQCPDCYQDWLTAADSLDEQTAVTPETTPAPIVSPVSTQPGRSGWRRSWRSFLDSPLIAGWPWASVAVVILMATVLILLPQQSIDINTHVSEIYQIARVNHSQLLAIEAQSLSLPWEGTTLGFSALNSTMSEKAFGAGLWQGRAKLADTDDHLPKPLRPPANLPWLSGSEADYYTLGRWMVFSWGLTRTAETDWRLPQQTLATLLEQLSQHTRKDKANQQTITAIKEIQILLSQLQLSAKSDDRDKLERHLISIMHRLGPNNL